MFGTIALHLTLAVIVAGGGFALASVASSLVGDELHRRGTDPDLRVHAVAILESVFRLGAALAALAVLGVPVAQLVGLLALTTAVGAYAGRDVLRDGMAGAWLFQTRPFRTGDRVQIGDTVGVVKTLTWLAITITQDDGGQVTIPTHLVSGGSIRVLPKPTP